MSDPSEYLSEFRPRLQQPNAQALCNQVPHLSADDTNDAVMELFTRHRDLNSLPVVELKRPIGLINRNIFMSQMSQPFRHELYGRKSCIAFMDKQPLVVEGSVDLEELTFKAVAHGEKALADGFIITRDGEFAGVGHGLQLMRVVADLQASRNRQIMHSIEYASVIQQSTLRSSREALALACRDADLVWEPRDVVGGDFYQFSRAEDGWFATVADCTGHGVPGAFMTLIASTSLNQAIGQHGPRDPAALLGHVNRSIKQVLGQMDGKDGTPGSDDGMDAACFWFEPATGRLVFAGARLSLFVLRPGAEAVEFVEGQRKGVGYVDSEFDFAWRNQALTLPAGSLVFITTDGLIDQIGGARAISFGKRRLRELLLAHAADTAAGVNQAVLQALRQWQGANHRRDDLTFFCFRT
ncbi:SpoIIE family protein phosphatase [Xylophilus sp. Kf1]|nr:SpoIIE family protein phosphatase [Xylophilus sp. Kf1]